MSRLILVRHGQSIWNKENIFTGWTDVALSQEGASEAKNAAQSIKNNSISFDLAFVSVLKRAIHTLNIIAEVNCLDWVNQYRSWRLNERHYGALQGLNKSQVANEFGEKQVKIWRRSFDVKPPLLNPSDKRNPKFDPIYKNLDSSCLPLGESLKDCINRTMPFWYDAISPALIQGKNTIVVAHGNSLRGLVKYLDKISDAEIPNLEIPTATPIVYEFDKNLTVLKKFVLNRVS